MESDKTQTIFFNWLGNFRAFLYLIFAGKGIGKKFPIFWRIYDFFFCLFSSKNFVHTVNEVKLLIDLEEPHYHFRRILEDYASLSEYEPNTVRVLKKIIKKGDTVLDVGASIGPLSLVMSNLVGDTGKVISIEPTPICFYYLCENIKLNGKKNIFPNLVGAWDKNELFKVQQRLRRPFWANGIILDDFLEYLGIEKVDFIKMDIDGPEPRALKGLIRTIERNPNLKMIVEYYPKYIKEAGNSPEEMMAILDKYFTHEKIEGDYGDGYWNFYCVRK